MKIIRWMALLFATSVSSGSVADDPQPVSLFDGKSLTGWEGNTKHFRIADGAIVGGSLTEKVPRNEFLMTTKEYGDFELTLKFKLLGKGANAGVQFHSRRIPNHHEVRGYQADLGDGWWGCLYDESRRNKKLAGPDAKEAERMVKRDGWNDYRIRAEKGWIRMWINDSPTVNYHEKDESIEQKGLIGVQIHGGPPSEAWYKDIQIVELSGK